MTEEKQKNVKESPKYPNKGAEIHFDHESMVIYLGYFKAIESLKNEHSQLECWRALGYYGFCGIEPETNDDSVRLFFQMAKPQIDRNIARYDASVNNGKKGGRPPKNKANEKPRKTQQNLTKPKRNLNDNVNENENDNVNDNENENVLSERDYLNSLSPKDKTFFLSYKSFKINANIDPDKHNIEAIKKAIEKSDFLQSSNMAFVLNNYNKVINGYYDSFKTNDNAMLIRTLSDEELKNLTSCDCDWEDIDFDEPDTRTYPRSE